ncbi:oligoendopeptidase F [Alkalihalobacillus oceani]|uniref:oligoendopeptidase F n=1 Tax=Halalkalibacter oceani TaxID=1653776 RepID=UPI0020417B0C|nr:oligoendopeptidase F [Halalkalibacter oceani]MCM3760812.1 oligoendopeptidase F [Halalkalibacter oceani]
MKSYSSRQDVPEHEKWNLSDIFPTTVEWEEACGVLESKIEKLAQYNGRLSDADSLHAFLVLSEEIDYDFRKVYVYAMLQVDIDTRVTASQSLLDRAKKLAVSLAAAKSFFMPFLLKLKPETLKQYIAEKKELAYFEEDLYDSYRYKKHILSEEKEEILSQLGEALQVPSHTFGMINNADIVFGEVTDENGDKIPLTRGMYAKRMEDEDREKRAEAYQAYYKPYKQMKNTIASTLSAAIKNNVMISRMRYYPSALEKGLFSDEVPKDVYETLIETTKANIEPMHEYIRLRKELLEVEQLKPYDLAVPLVSGVKEEIPFDEAFEIMIDSLAPLGADYQQTLRSFKTKRYFDVRETPGKRSGAYNIGVYGVHPFVLLNHRDDLDSLFTLTHESGHAMHSWYSSRHQPQISAGYSIFVAEVASTVNEMLLIRYLLAESKEDNRRKFLLNHFIDSFKGTFFTQVMFAEFEKLTHEKAEKGEPLHADAFNDIYEELYRTYNGSALECDEEVKFGWTRIPHFYRPFYVYKYATGYAAANVIAERLLRGDAATQASYLQFLKGGSSKPPLELLKDTGVDLTKPDTIEDALVVFGGLVKQFAEL